ncbi:MAG: hypothetical protein ACRDZO_03340 [Egibacteraceae bacterium]
MRASRICWCRCAGAATRSPGTRSATAGRLHPVGPLVLGGPMFWPLAQAPEVLRCFGDFAGEAPDELGLSVVTMLAPPMPFLPADCYGKPVVGMILVWSGDLAEGERVLAPLRRVGTPLADAVRPVPYLAVQSMLDAGARTPSISAWARVGATSSPVRRSRRTTARRRRCARTGAGPR